MSRKIVQIATSSCAKGHLSEGFGSLQESENLYALDSDGQIWQWCPATKDETSGWVELPEPWDNPPQPKPPQPAKSTVKPF